MSAGIPPRVVYVVAYRTMTCPHCRRVFDDPNSAFNRAIDKAQRDPRVDLRLRVVVIDPRDPVSVLEAEEAGVKYVPAVFINGELVPNEYLRDEEVLLGLIYGRVVAPKPKRGILDRTLLPIRRWWRR